MPFVRRQTGTRTVTFASTDASSLISSTDPINTYNASDYSHSTVFVTSATEGDLFTKLNVPQLTTYYTAPTECVDRWMLAGEA
ncbi:hypothetical protein E8E13_001919 [Curvularia kusanoi]|uniref:Uncharacterized protein n=1 Tax=Curvularia kusanoi TaxID=90978 RepID=A0A9P4T5Q5_CURKU|nr:hypothetical protein E8E13_001919 [Curvularia kusanoi]